MKIRKDNYEEFFAGYLDGRLTDAEIAELENFLLENPELRKELEGLESIVLIPGKIKFDGKEQLKQLDLTLPVTAENFDSFCIAEIEDIIDVSGKEALSRYISEHPEKEMDRELFTRLRLTPDPTLRFNSGYRLKKSVFNLYRKEIIYSVSMAAGIALLAGVYFRFINERPLQGTGITSLTYPAAGPVDTTSVRNSSQSTTGKPASVKNAATPDQESQPQAKTRKRSFSIKVEMPVVTPNPDVRGNNRVDEKKILGNLTIDPRRLNNAPLASLNPITDKVNHIRVDYTDRDRHPSAIEAETRAVEQFAVQKFSNIIFGERAPRELTVWSVVSAGLDKVNDLTGSKMTLERETDSDGETKALKFNSKLLKIDTPVHQDDK